MLLFHQGEECICADRIANASERKGLDLQLFKHRATSDISNPSQMPNSSQLVVLQLKLSIDFQKIDLID